jgi:hypothetical protein
MIEFLLLVIIAIMLFGSSAVIGAAGLVLGVIVLIIALTVFSKWTGMSPEVLVFGFFGLIGLLAILNALGVFEPKPNRPPEPKPLTPQQKHFLNNIEEYHRIKDQLYANKTELFTLRLNKDADPEKVAQMESDVMILEQRLKELGG